LLHFTVAEKKKADVNQAGPIPVIGRRV